MMTFQKIEAPSHAQSKVVTADRLDYESRDGWMVVGSFVQPVSERVGDWDSKEYRDVDRMHFLLIRSPDGAVVEMKKQMDDSMAAALKSDTQVQELKQAAKVAQQSLTEATERISKLDAELRQANSSLLAAQKMEQDIASIRIAIGDHRMREIIGT